MPGGVHPPLSVLLTFPTPNYINPETHSFALPAINIALWFIATVIVLGRLYIRLRVQKNAGADDLLIGLALVLIPMLNFKETY
jgi:hypothetical protein